MTSKSSANACLDPLICYVTGEEIIDSKDSGYFKMPTKEVLHNLSNLTEAVVRFVKICI